MLEGDGHMSRCGRFIGRWQENAELLNKVSLITTVMIVDLNLMSERLLQKENLSPDLSCSEPLLLQLQWPDL